MYSIETFQENLRFSDQYHALCDFLKAHADCGYNEHFHWGRLDWMMAHSYLETEELSKNALFRDENGELTGAVVYDTSFSDRWYLLHSLSDETLLRQMIEYAAMIDAGTVTIKANQHDAALCRLLHETGFQMQSPESVLALDLSSAFSVELPQGFDLNAPDSQIDRQQWRLVIYRGFDNEGTPQEPGGEVAAAEKHLDCPQYIKVFARRGKEYAAHCGVWYDGGDTAYIEPVVTLPEYRGKGLGRAVVYEAVNRARKRGAKRAIVLSDQEFYLRLGMTRSSQVTAWIRTN